MTIGVDGNDANVEQRVGVSVYTLSLLERFKKKADSKNKFIVFLRNEPRAELPSPNEFFRYEIVKGKFLWSQVFLPLRLLFKKDIDVFFSPAHYSPRLCPVQLIVTIHDLSYFDYPGEFLKKDLYKLKNWTKYSVKKASKVIAVSENTKKDLIKFYGVPENKVEVVYNGYEKETRDSKFEIRNSSYVLYVGTLQPRKNIPTLIRAFAKFKKANPQYTLVITGKKGWLYDEIFELTKSLGLEKSIKFTGYVNDKELTSLYKNAYCLVLPSFYEGFGIPVLEAMSNSCPVITSNTSSLPEIAKDAALYFDPKDEDELVEKLESLSDENLRKELIEKGKTRIKLFSWDKCADQTLEIIKNAA